MSGQFPLYGRPAAPAARSLARAALAGLGATVAMDLSARAVVSPALDTRPPGPDTLGRWIGHMREGRFTHDHIEATNPVAREIAVGATAHYLIGPALGVGYVLLLRLTRRPHGSFPSGSPMESRPPLSPGSSSIPPTGGVPWAFGVTDPNSRRLRCSTMAYTARH